MTLRNPGQTAAVGGRNSIDRAPLRIRAEEEILAIAETSGSQVLTVTPAATVFTPSRRLSCAVTLAFHPTTRVAIGTHQTSTWTLRAQRQSRLSRAVVNLHALESGIAVPRMYELDSAIRRLRVETSLQQPQDGASANLAGQWVLSVEWEPNQFICDEEAFELLQLCSIKPEFREPPTLRP